MLRSEESTLAAYHCLRPLITGLEAVFIFPKFAIASCITEQDHSFLRLISEVNRGPGYGLLDLYGSSGTIGEHSSYHVVPSFTSR